MKSETEEIHNGRNHEMINDMTEIPVTSSMLLHMIASKYQTFSTILLLIAIPVVFASSLE